MDRCETPRNREGGIRHGRKGGFYKKSPDTLYKIQYLIIFRGQYKGDHQFYEIGFWRGWFDTESFPVPNDVTVTFI